MPPYTDHQNTYNNLNVINQDLDVHYTQGVICDHSRRFSQHCKSLYFKVRGNKIRPILLKQFHLITFDINIVKHPWFIQYMKK